MALSVPVVFVVYKRLECARRVLEKIRQAAPRKLYVIADGPKNGVPEEDSLCHEVRRYIDDAIDWPCEVYRDYSAMNLGCRQRFSSGLNWVFSSEEQAIILEDDCVPDHSFFPFCEELLNEYRDNHKIMTISGDNFVHQSYHCQDSYYFSQYMHCWGWATWRRAWRHYDVDFCQWPALRNRGWLRGYTFTLGGWLYWRWMLDEVFSGKIDTWDVVWTFSIWRQSGLNILPSVNLVRNIGFTRDATHTKTSWSQQEEQPASNMVFPLRHPARMIQNIEADARSQSLLYSIGPSRLFTFFYERLANLIFGSRRPKR